MLFGLDALGRPVIGQIRNDAGTPVPVLSDATQEQPQLRGFLDKRFRIAIIASGEVRGGINPIIPSFGYFQPLSTPAKRYKMPAYEQMVISYGNQKPEVSFSYYNWLAEPRRFPKGLKTYLHPFTNQQDSEYIPRPNTLFAGWYGQLSVPVRIKPGLKSGLQQSWVGPTRLLPNPNVTVTMSAFEVNTDQALMAIRVFPYNPPAGATVSIVEVGTAGSATSVWED